MQGLQTRIISFLAIERKKGNEVITTEQVRRQFGLSTGQVTQTKSKLAEKGFLENSPRGTLILKGESAYHGEFTKRVCSHLTTKGKRPCYCPVKKVFIDERHYKEMCGCWQCINYDNPLQGVY